MSKCDISAMKEVVKGYFPCAFITVEVFLHTGCYFCFNEVFYMWFSQSTSRGE